MSQRLTIKNITNLYVSSRACSNQSESTYRTADPLNLTQNLSRSTSQWKTNLVLIDFGCGEIETSPTQLMEGHEGTVAILPSPSDQLLIDIHRERLSLWPEQSKPGPP